MELKNNSIFPAHTHLCFWLSQSLSRITYDSLSTLYIQHYKINIHNYNRFVSTIPKPLKKVCYKKYVYKWKIHPHNIHR